VTSNRKGVESRSSTRNSLASVDPTPPPPEPARPRKGWNLLRKLAHLQASIEKEAQEPVHAEGTDRYRLAYDAGVHALAQQDGTLGNLRNRATGLVTISTLIASFTGFFGVGTKDNPLPWPLAIGLIAFVLLVVGCSVYVLRPVKEWLYGPDVEDILTSPQPSDELLLWSQALGMKKAILENEGTLQKRSIMYSIGVSLLGLEAMYAVAVALVSR
jgi:hypothetical protein